MARTIILPEREGNLNLKDLSAKKDSYLLERQHPEKTTFHETTSSEKTTKTTKFFKTTSSS